jgi:hypothetical protein
MLAATQKTLITALAAAAGLAAIALTPATALADLPSAQAAQAADARAAAAALLAGPKDSSTAAHRAEHRPALTDADPTDRLAGDRTATEGSTVDSNPFNANGEDELSRAAAVTAGTDNAQRRIVRTVRRKPKRRARRHVRRRY